MEESIVNDPAAAIGTAKELIETVCKTILDIRDVRLDGSPDIPKLTKEVLRQLSLIPEGVDESKRGAQVIQRVLRSLGTIGNDLAELRGLYGTGHGKAAGHKGLGLRHARLAVGAAATFVTFLWETHQDRPKGLPDNGHSSE